MKYKLEKHLIDTLNTLYEAEDKLAASYDFNIPDYHLGLLEHATSQIEAAFKAVLLLKNEVSRKGY